MLRMFFCLESDFFRWYASISILEMYLTCETYRRQAPTCNVPLHSLSGDVNARSQISQAVRELGLCGRALGVIRPELCEDCNERNHWLSSNDDVSIRWTHVW